MRCVFLLICLLLCGKSLAKSSTDEGKEYGKKHLKEAIGNLGQINPDDFLAKEEKGKVFDAENAKDMLNKEVILDTEVTQFLTDKNVIRNARENVGFHEEEYFIKRSDDITKDVGDGIKTIRKEEETNVINKTCQQAGNPYPVSFVRNLRVDVVHHPQKTKRVRRCLGHKKTKHFDSEKDARKYQKKKEKELSEDPEVSYFNIDIEGGGLFHRYRVVREWTHLDNARSCDAYENSVKVVQEEKWEERGEEWVNEDGLAYSLSQTPQCVLIERQCLDDTPKIINGKEVIKKCWREKLSYLCQHQVKLEDSCEFLKKNNCQEIRRRCLQDTANGCALWSIDFRCFTKKNKLLLSSEEGIVGLNEEDWDTTFENNNSFADISLKLAIFDEIKKDLNTIGTIDATKVEIFKGKKMKCSKSVADDLLYDCCYSFGGLANKLNISHCTSDEISLAEMRAKGLCHYVGKKKGEFLGLWKSRDDHLFCCFSSKLARIFQEESRGQLNISWGDAKKPDCRGLTSAEIAKVDFSRVDLSEMFEDAENKKVDSDKKLDDFSKKLKEKMENLAKEEKPCVR